MNRAFYLPLVVFVVIVLMTISKGADTIRNSKYIVTITSTGFSPKALRILNNSTVVFVNKDTVNHWPASDFHPDHTLYPAFDPRKPVKPGSSWSFQPRRAGIFKFHDHLFPHTRGTLSVENSPHAIVEISENLNFLKKISATIDPKKFQKIPEKQKYIYLARQVKLKGAVAAWKFLEHTYPGDYPSNQQLHNLAHFIGNKIFEEKGIEGLTDCSELFLYGCYHGIANRALLNDISALPDMEVACGRLAPAGTAVNATCLHGIGHGIATFFESESDGIRRSLTACDSLTHDQTGCHSAVFMEYGIDTPDGKDPLLVCRKFDSRYYYACAGWMSYVAEKIYKFSFPDIIAMCLSEKNTLLGDACIDENGAIVGLRAQGDRAKIMEKCSLVSGDKQRSSCITAAAEAALNRQFTSGGEAFSYCKEMSGDYASLCNKRIEIVLSYYRLGRPVSGDSIDPKKFTNLPEKKKYEYLNRLITQSGAVLTWQQLIAAYAARYPTSDEFHNLAHFLGGKMYEERGIEALIDCTPLFIYGCYHGVADRALTNNLDMLPDMEKVCTRLGPYGSTLYMSCLHGIGHAIASTFDPPDLKAALLICDRFSHDQPACHQGVMMEYSFGMLTSAQAANPEAPRGLISACNQLDRQYRIACVGRLMHQMENPYGLSLAEISHICIEEKDAVTRRACIEMVGLTAGTRSNGAPNGVLERCKDLEKEDAIAVCVTKGLEQIILLVSPGWENAVEGCGLLPALYQTSCRNQVGQMLEQFANYNKHPTQ